VGTEASYLNFLCLSFNIFFYILREKDLFIYFLLVLCWGYIVTFTKVLTIYNSCIHSVHLSPLFPSPIPRIVLTVLIFPFIYMYTQYWHHIHPFLISSPSHWYQSPGRTCSTLLFSIFVKKKKKKKRHFQCLS
jgi:hypothetical protein